MGKQQQQHKTLPPENSPVMSASPPAMRRRKKKGRPSLLDLQKRSLRLEKLHDPPSQPEPNPNPSRRGARRNPNPEEVDDDDDEAEGSRREKKLRLVMRLPDESAKGEKTSSARKATDAVEEPSDSGPTTPLPDKKLLVFILDRLQKKDTYGVFSEPVDPEELPDYHDIIKHPMDFATIRKKLDEGGYANLEQFEDDVFLITSNAMCYNSPDTIYYRQARAIQELAKKDFENLRQESDTSEPEPEPEPEPKQQPRRGRPPSKNTVKQKLGRPPADRATADFSGATLANAGNSGRLSYMGFDLLRKGTDKAGTADVQRASYGFRNIENNWSDERKSERSEDYPGSGIKGFAKFGKKPLVIDESRRSTYNQPQPSNSMYELPVSTSYNGTRKLLVPVGLQMQHSYSRSLARFAAQLGPVGWEIAAKRIERILPHGTKFGRGWVGDGEVPRPFQPPLLTSSPPHPSTQSKISVTPPCKPAASRELPANSLAIEESRAGTSQSAGAHPSAAPNVPTSTIQRLNSAALASQQSGSIPQISRVGGEEGVQMKGPYNLHAHSAMQQNVNGFNTARGANTASQVGKFVGSSVPPGSFGSEPAMIHANLPFRSNHGHIYSASGWQPDSGRARSSGDPSSTSTSDIALHNSSHDHQGLQRGLSQHPASGSAPPDLNVGFQSPRSPRTSSMVVDPQHPDLVLQL